MKKWKEKWNSWSVSEKVEWVICLLCTIGVIVLPLFRALGIWTRASRAYDPLLAVLLLIQARREWREKNRVLAVFCLALAAAYLVAIGFTLLR